MSFLLSTKQDSRTASEILYKYLVNTELLRNAFLDELQDNFFEKIVLSFHDQISGSSGENSEDYEVWHLYGNRLIENIASDAEEEEDLEIELEHETFRGALDRFGNGYGNFLFISIKNIHEKNLSQPFWNFNRLMHLYFRYTRKNQP